MNKTKTLIIVALLAIVSAELFLRLTYKGPPQHDPLTPVFFNDHDVLRFEILRKATQLQVRDEKDFNIVVTGGSVAYGWGASSEENRFTSKLQKNLNEKYPGKNIHVFNAGVPDFEAIDELSFYLRFLRTLQPKTVIMLSGFNDLWDSSKRQLINDPYRQLSKISEYHVVPADQTWLLFLSFAKSAAFRIKNQIRKISYIYRFLDDKLMAIEYIPVKNLADFDVKRASNDLMSFIKVAEAFSAVTKQDGIEFALVLQPMRSLTHLSQADLPRSQWEHRLEMVYREFLKPELKGFKMKSKTTVADLNDEFVDDLVKKNCFLDFCHLNDEGNELMAKKVAEIIERELPSFKKS